MSVSKKVYVAERAPHGGPGLAVYVEEDGKRTPLRHHVRHSPTGFEAGYAGSGPSDLARCILIDLFDLHDADPADWRRVEAIYQTFKFKVIAEKPRSGFQIEGAWIEDWLRANE